MSVTKWITGLEYKGTLCFIQSDSELYFTALIDADYDNLPFTTREVLTAKTQI
ncbi:MAG: hypothetical protein NTW85_00860 [Methylococcales bacterium]|nr:hypothetical protein [Methylococcales bacterium]